MVVNKSPFESKYGFRGPGFTVDLEGNIVANSITLSNTDEDTNLETPADYTITELEGNFNFGNLGTNPVITLARGSRYIFDLDLEVLDFTLFDENQTGLLISGLTHTDGSTGANAQSKQTGRLFFTVSSSTPDTIYYGSTTQTGSVYQIDIIDSDASFNHVFVNGIDNSTTRDTGSLIVAGGVAVQGNIFVDQNLITSEITSNTNLTISANNGIVVLGNDSSIVGTIQDSGSTIPVLNTTITNSSASLTEASLSSAPTTQNDITNKKYVDSQITALAIALGI